MDLLLNDEIAIAPHATEEDIDDIIAAISRLETGEDVEIGEDGEIVGDAAGGQAAPVAESLDRGAPAVEADRDAPRGMDGALGTARGPRTASQAAAEKKARQSYFAARKVRNVLDERNLRLLRESVLAIGANRAKKLLKRVVTTQREGGMDTADGSRKRTPGGVFFFLLREEMDAPSYRKLMNADKKRKTKEHEARVRAFEASGGRGRGSSEKKRGADDGRCGPTVGTGGAKRPKPRDVDCALGTSR